MSNPILSWRRVRALCVKETRQIVRDPSSCWNSVAKRRWISPTP